MINRVVLVGRLTRDPQLRKTPNGASVTSFTVACDRRGEKVEGQPTADFINCVCWNRTADVVAQYTHKGSLVGVEGRIQTRSYDDQSGKRVFVTEVVADSVQFLEPRGTGQPTTNPADTIATPTTQQMPHETQSYGAPAPQQMPYGAQSYGAPAPQQTPYGAQSHGAPATSTSVLEDFTSFLPDSDGDIPFYYENLK